MPDFGDIAGKRTAILGGMGFIGSNLARRLADLGAEVTVLDSLEPDSGGNPANLLGYEERVGILRGSMGDPAQLRRALKGSEIVFNLAAQTSHLESMRDPNADLVVNVAGQLALLEECRASCPRAKVVFTSTRQIYGRPEYLPIDEGHPIRPVDINGVHKAAAEAYLRVYGDVYKLRWTVLRLTNTYGPRLRIKDARQMFLGVWLRRILEGKPFEVWGGEQKRDFNYVDDVVDALVLCASRPEAEHAIFNLGAPAALSLRELADLLVRTNGGGSYELKPYPSERLAIEIGDFQADFALIRNRLGWAPRVDLDEGLARSLEFYRQNLPCYL